MQSLKKVAYIFVNKGVLGFPFHVVTDCPNMCCTLQISLPLHLNGYDKGVSSVP